MEDFEGEKRYAVYTSFRVSSPADKYKLEVGEYLAEDAHKYVNNSVIDEAKGEASENALSSITGDTTEIGRNQIPNRARAAGKARRRNALQSCALLKADQVQLSILVYSAT